MAQTVLSTSTPYATAADLFVFHDSNQCADMLAGGNAARPSVADMSNTTTVVGNILNRILLSASGRIESTALVGLRYSPADLNALVGSGTAGEQILIKLTCDIAFWQLCQRRQPNASDPKNVPGAMEAMDYLKKLGEGENIFAFTESAEAGLPSVVPPNPQRLVTPNVVSRAYRLFPRCYLNNFLGPGPAPDSDG